MRSVSITINQKSKLLIGLLLSVSIISYGQENSPYSRYGLGDLVPTANVVNRSMGGIAAAFSDYDNRYDQKDRYQKPQTVNFLNPASYGKLRITSFDLGFEIDNRTLHSIDPIEKFKSASAIISYVQLGIPLNRKHGLGMVIGLRPITRINYKIQQNSRVAGIDSLSTLFQGSGGTYQVYTGFGKSFKNLSIGVNAGYFFGTKDFSTRKIFIPDSLDRTYYKSNYETKTTIGGLFYDLGAQYRGKLNKTTFLHLGVYGNARQKFNLTKENLAETFDYDANGAVKSYDTVSYFKNIKGKLDYPSTVGVGLMIEKQDRWMVGMDFIKTSWDNYRFFGEADAVKSNWMLKVGGQITPNLLKAKNYWNLVTYRAGFNVGPDYISANGKLPQFGITAGAGFPVRRNPYTNQYTSINLGLEYGKRGNNNNIITENIFRITLGLTLSDLWFVKKKYD